MRMWNWIFMLSICGTVNAQVLQNPTSAYYTGAGAYSVDHTDVFSFTANPAALAQEKEISAGVYGERRFLMAALSNYRLAAVLPTPSGNFGLEGDYFGFNNYNQSRLGLAYSRQLGKKLSAGLQFNYHAFAIAGYGKMQAITIGAGAVFHLTELLNAGIRINNPPGAGFGAEKLPFAYTGGFGYDASEKVFISLEILKEKNQPVSINAGIQYEVTRRLLLRAGLATATGSGCLGIGFFWSDFRFDVVSGVHPLLGITPGFLFCYNLKKKKSYEN
jgi:hypothetical protein